MRRFRLLPLYYLKRLFCNNVALLPEPNTKFQFKHVDMIKEFTGSVIISYLMDKKKKKIGTI